MKLIKQNGPHCLVTSAAMCLDVDVGIIHKMIGCDGTQILWQNPPRMRGIHIQEILDVALAYGKCFYPIEMYPEIAPDYYTESKRIYNDDLAHVRFLKSVYGKTAIFIVDGHAVAYDGEKVYDPRGFNAGVGDYKIIEAWVMSDLI